MTNSIYFPSDLQCLLDKQHIPVCYFSLLKITLTRQHIFISDCWLWVYNVRAANLRNLLAVGGHTSEYLCLFIFIWACEYFKVSLFSLFLLDSLQNISVFQSCVNSDLTAVRPGCAAGQKTCNRSPTFQLMYRLMIECWCRGTMTLLDYVKYYYY